MNILFENKFISLEYLANNLGVSKKTLKNNIKDLNNILLGVGFIQVKRNTCKLYIFDYDKFKLNVNNICNFDSFFNSSTNRMNYVMSKLLNNKEYLIDDLAEEMNVSRTTLIGDLSKLRQNLKNYSLNVVGKPNKGLHIEGNEIDIRIYLVKNIDSFKDYDLDEEIVNFIKYECSKKEFTLESVKSLLKYYTISLLRYRNGYKITNTFNRLLDLDSTQAYSIVNEISKNIEKKFMIEIPKIEKLFVTLSIIGTRVFSDNSRTNKEIVKLAIDLIEHINTEFNISIVPNNLFADFINHLTLMLNRIKYDIKIENCFINEIKEKYPFAYSIAEIAGKFILSLTQLDICDNELGFLAMYFELFIRESNIVNIRKVAVVTDASLIASKIIVNNLNNILNYKSKIDILSSRLENINKNEYDLIVTTINLNIDIDVPIIYIKEILNIRELKEKIINIKYYKMLDRPFLKGLDFITLSMLSEVNFLVLDAEKDYFENLVYMVDYVIEKKMVDIEFKHRILNKEKKSPMIFRNVALPHSINYENDKPILILGVCNNPIKFNGNDLKLIFLLAIPDDQNLQDDILLKIYDEIIFIANDIKKIDSISKLNNYRELLMYFVEHIQE